MSAFDLGKIHMCNCPRYLRVNVTQRLYFSLRIMADIKAFCCPLLGVSQPWSGAHRSFASWCSPAVLSAAAPRTWGPRTGSHRAVAVACSTAPPAAPAVSWHPHRHADPASVGAGRADSLSQGTRLCLISPLNTTPGTAALRSNKSVIIQSPLQEQPNICTQVPTAWCSGWRAEGNGYLVPQRVLLLLQADLFGSHQLQRFLRRGVLQLFQALHRRGPRRFAKLLLVCSHALVHGCRWTQTCTLLTLPLKTSEYMQICVPLPMSQTTHICKGPKRSIFS